MACLYVGKVTSILPKPLTQPYTNPLPIQDRLDWFWCIFRVVHLEIFITVEGQPLTITEMKFSEFLSENSITGAALTANQNGINFFAADTRVAAIMTRAETPAEEDLLQWCSDRMDHSCTVDRQGFITLQEPRKVTSLESLFAPAAPAGKK